MLSTAKTTVRSAARAGGAVATVPARTRALKSFFMGASPFFLGAEQQRGDVVECKGCDYERRRKPQCELHEAAADRAGAGSAVGAGLPRLPVHQVEAVAENASRARHEQRLVRR